MSDANTRFIRIHDEVWINPDQVAMVRRSGGGNGTEIVFPNGRSELLMQPLDNVLALLGGPEW